MEATLEARGEMALRLLVMSDAMSDDEASHRCKPLIAGPRARKQRQERAKKCGEGPHIPQSHNPPASGKSTHHKPASTLYREANGQPLFHSAARSLLPALGRGRRAADPPTVRHKCGTSLMSDRTLRYL